MIKSRNKIKAIYPVLQDVSVKMLKYMREEMRKPSFEGFDVVDVNIFLWMADMTSI